MWSKILCQINQEILKTKKNQQLESSSTNVHIVLQDVALRDVLFKILCLEWSVKNAACQRFYKKFERHFYMKIIFTVIPII